MPDPLKFSVPPYSEVPVVDEEDILSFDGTPEEKADAIVKLAEDKGLLDKPAGPSIRPASTGDRPVIQAST